MEFTPFTLEQARDIAEDFEDLIDTDIKMDDGIYEVIDVIISPFSEDAGRFFIDEFLLTKDKVASLAFYNSGEYDVVVFAGNINDPEKNVFIDIRTFAGQRGISYNFPCQ